MEEVQEKNIQKEKENVWNHLTLEEIRAKLHKFANERDWEKYHNPRNLLLALVGEVGELAEIFQWTSDDAANNLKGFDLSKKEHIADEIADCFLYLTRFADRCGIDLPKAIEIKLEKNAKKYPIKFAKGSCKKYTEFCSDITH